MSEEEIINNLKELWLDVLLVNDLDKFLCSNDRYRKSIEKILDLYNKEKEKNKDIERYKRIANQKLDDIEEFRKNECNHRCIKNAELEEFKDYMLENYISKNKIKEKIQQVKDNKENYTFKELTSEDIRRTIITNLQDLLEEDNK